MKVHSRILSPAVARGTAVLCAAVLATSVASTAHAAGVVGTGTAASCTDAALDAALAGGGLVTFNCGSAPATIDISSPGSDTKTIANHTIIDGGGLITISERRFHVYPRANFVVENLTIANGIDSGDIVTGIGGRGGGIRNDGTLTVTNSTFTGNSVRDNVQGAGEGGAIFNSGTLTVTNSTFTGNSAYSFGGGIANDDGTLTVTNSTFTRNSAGPHVGDEQRVEVRANELLVGPGSRGVHIVPQDNGGGIFNFGTLTITNSTFTGNSAGNGGGIYNEFGGAAVIRNTIVANSPSGDNCSGTITDGGHNLDDGTSCGFSAANGSLSNTNPQLDAAGLKNNGGPTETVALCTAVGVPTGCTDASPAIDAGDQFECASAPVNARDQRGFVRPGINNAQCSIGAYEADATSPEVCVGDCTGTQTVAVNDIITLVNIALGNAQTSACPHGVPNGVAVDIAMLVQAVNSALSGCSAWTPCGVFLTTWGTFGTGNGQFVGPKGIAVDGSGNVYVADDNHRIQKFSNSGTFLTTWGSVGSGDGQFAYPGGVAVDGNGNVFVADRANARIQKFTNTGTFLSKWGSLGTGDGQFSSPEGVAVDGSGNVYVTDWKYQCLDPLGGEQCETLVARIEKFTNTGTFLTTWGSPGGGDGQFGAPFGIAVDQSGNVYVADYDNGSVQKFTNTGTFLAELTTTFGRIGFPLALAINGSGYIFVTDTDDNLVDAPARIDKFTNTGTFLTAFGSPGTGAGQFGNGGPQGVAVDGSGNIFVADTNNNRIEKFACP